MVGPDFVLEVEVYCSVPAEDPPISKLSTPIKMFKKLRSDQRYKDMYNHIIPFLLLQSVITELFYFL